MKKDKIKKNTEEFVKLYVPELLQLVESGDEKMCLMMAQLEYWFGLKPDGFYKFMTPAKGDNPAYREGDSWTEEMGMSDSKIANGLKPICAHYQSFTDYKKEEGDKFKGKFYCSYYHKPSHQTHYFRNHDLVNPALRSLSLGNKSVIFREKHSARVGNNEKVFSGDTITCNPEVIDGEVVFTETNPKNTSKEYSDITQEREGSSHFENQEIREEKKDVTKKAEEIYESSFGDIFRDLICNDGVSIGNGISVQEDMNGWQAAKNVAVAFPADFGLTEHMVAWAEENNPGIDVQRATNKFKLYNADNVSKDWLKKWQLWIMNENLSYSNSAGDYVDSQTEVYRELYESFMTGDNK